MGPFLAQSGGGTTLVDAVKNFFNDFKTTLQYIGPITIFLGVCGVAMLYALPPFPVMSQWKAQNPTAISALFLGIGLLIAAGTLMSLIAFT